MTKEKLIKVTAITEHQDDDGVTVNLWGYPFTCKTIDKDGKALSTYTAQLPEDDAKAFIEAGRVK